MIVALSKNVSPSPERRGADYDRRLGDLGHDVFALPGLVYAQPASDLWRDAQDFMDDRASLIRGCDVLVAANTLDIPVGTTRNVSDLSIHDMTVARLLGLPVVLTDKLPALSELGGDWKPADLALTSAGGMILAATGLACGSLEGDFTSLPDIVNNFRVEQGEGG